jgi:hypothetical protein
MSKQLTPKYLTREIAKEAVETVIDAMMNGNPPMRDRLKQRMCHIVVIVPSVEDVRAEDYPEWLNYQVTPNVLYEKSVGDKGSWPDEFDNIARGKALQLWRGQNFDGNTDSVAHLLFPDDTLYWGGVYRHGVVVTCSGVQPYFDQMISGMVADMIKALARHAFEESDDKKEGRSFLA